MLCSQESSVRIRKSESAQSDEKQPHYNKISSKDRTDSLYIPLSFALLIDELQVTHLAESSIFFLLLAGERKNELVYDYELHFLLVNISLTYFLSLTSK
jgi:hypothetical protein